MLKLLLLALLIGGAARASAQVSDIISVTKKSGKNVRSFIKGTSIDFVDRDGRFIRGPIANIAYDSIWVTQYQTVMRQNMFGTYSIDTVHSYLYADAVANIARIKTGVRQRFLLTRLVPIIIKGGVGYTALSTINGNASWKNAGIGLGAAAVGFLIGKLFRGSEYSSRHDRINYIKMQPGQ